MSWIAVSPLQGRTPAARPAIPAMSRPAAGLPRGTLLMELDAPLPDRGRVLFAAACAATGQGGLRLLRDTGGRVAAEIDGPAGPVRGEIALGRMDRAPVLRLMLSWDKGAGQSRLWACAPKTDITPLVSHLPGVPETSVGDLGAAVSDPQTAGCPAELSFVALSDAVEPVGPMPGLAAGSHILTPDGPRRIDALKAGDTITALTERGEARPVPVLAALRQRLPARGSFRPVQLFAPYFGLTADAYVAANEHIALGGPDVEYLFARERVLAPARCLVSDRTGRWLAPADTVVWHQLLLPEQEQLRLSGCAVESLHLGHLRRNPEAHAQSLVADLPRSRLPHHARTTHPVVTEFEAATLLAQLSR